MALPAIGFLVLCAFLVASGMAVTSRGQSEAWANFLAKGLGWIPVIGDAAARVAVALSKYIAHELGHWAVQVEQQVVGWLAGVAHYIATAGYWSLLWPKELWSVVRWIKHVVVPRLVRVTPAPVVKIVNGTVRLSRTLETRLQRLEHSLATRARTAVIQVVPRPVRLAVRQIEWLRTHWKALTAAIAGAGAIALPWGGAGRLERDVLGLRKRLARLDRRTVGLGAVALVTAALARMGLSWIRCRNTRKVGKNVCGAGNLFGDLLAAEALFALGAISIVQYARELQSLMPAFAEGVSLLVREAPSFGDAFDPEWLADAGEDLLAHLL